MEFLFDRIKKKVVKGKEILVTSIFSPLSTLFLFSKVFLSRVVNLQDKILDCVVKGSFGTVRLKMPDRPL